MFSSVPAVPVRPVFQAHYRVVTAQDGLVLLSEDDTIILAEPIYAHLSPLLDGRPAEEIAAGLPGDVAVETVYEALEELARRGVLTTAEASSMAGPEAAWWMGRHVEPNVARKRLAQSPVAVHAFGAVTSDPFVAALRSAHVRVETEAAHHVVLVDDYLHPSLRAFNEARLDDGAPWLLIRPVGITLWIGPLVQPWQTACWRCLAQRLLLNRPVQAFLAARNGHGMEALPAAPPVHSAATHTAALHLAAAQVAAWIGQGRLPDAENRVQTLDLRTLSAQQHRLLQRPQCPACGVDLSGEEMPAQPVTLESCKKTYTSDGGHRVVTPDVTYDRYRHHISPITGAVDRLERISLSRAGIMHVYMGGYNTAVHRHSLKDLVSGPRGNSSGKGATDAQARASALCEALERYSLVYRGEEPRRRATMVALGEAAIHPNEVALFSERQFDERDAWNARGSRFNRVPERFDPHAEVDWSPLWSLTRQTHRYLPTGFLYMGYPFPDGRIVCLPCSNGNAAGNTLEEAVLQGFFEVVERDSVALWWYNRLRKPAVDFASFDDPYLERVQAYLREQGRTLWALDLTTDLGIPSFVALARLESGPYEDLMTGFGAHLDARIALLRAVSELVQLAARRIDQGPSEESLAAYQDDEVEHWIRTATLENQPYLVPDPAAPPRRLADFPKNWTDDLLDDIRYCQSLVEARGMEMLVLDQTRPDIQLPTAKVVVPGMRHFWARYAPGRLYEVPVEMDWLGTPLAEEDLNPIPYFL